MLPYVIILMKSVDSGHSKIASTFAPHVLIPNDLILLIEVNIVTTSAKPEDIWVQQLKWLKNHDLYISSLD